MVHEPEIDAVNPAINPAVNAAICETICNAFGMTVTIEILRTKNAIAKRSDELEELPNCDLDKIRAAKGDARLRLENSERPIRNAFRQKLNDMINAGATLVTLRQIYDQDLDIAREQFQHIANSIPGTLVIWEA